MERCLPELERAWELAEEVEGPRCVAADFNGDGADTWIYLLALPGTEDRPGESDLWFFDAGDNYRFFTSGRALANALTLGFQIREVKDLSGDGLPDLVATWQQCDETLCRTSLLLVSQHTGTLTNMVAVDASIDALATFEVLDDGVRMRGGITEDATVAAGPEREVVVTAQWTGQRFEVERGRGEPTYLVHLVDDADRAYEAGSFAEARDLYRQAASNQTLKDWKAEVSQGRDRPELQAYSLLRAAVITDRLNDRVGALTLLGRAVTQHGTTMHGAAANAYGEVLSTGGTTAAACGAAEDLLDTYQPHYSQFWDFGPGILPHEIYLLCR